MTIDLIKLRRELTSNGISNADLDSDPFVQFKIWMNQAVDAGLTLPNAMSLATSDESGVGIRTVLLKTFNEQGFVFFTNYNSKKSKQISSNPKVALLFPWLDLERQVKISGTVEKISTLESIKYFASRPKDSQLGAWASKQSSILNSRQVLLSEFDVMKRKFEAKILNIEPSESKPKQTRSYKTKEGAKQIDINKEIEDLELKIVQSLDIDEKTIHNMKVIATSAEFIDTREQLVIGKWLTHKKAQAEALELADQLNEIDPTKGSAEDILTNLATIKFTESMLKMRELYDHGVDVIEINDNFIRSSETNIIMILTDMNILVKVMEAKSLASIAEIQRILMPSVRSNSSLCLCAFLSWSLSDDCFSLCFSNINPFDC
jgi:pyridoxamine 5'-phosphate oxidase